MEFSSFNDIYFILVVCEIWGGGGVSFLSLTHFANSKIIQRYEYKNNLKVNQNKKDSESEKTQNLECQK